MAETSSDNKPGCGLLNAVFGTRGFWPRRPASKGSIPTFNDNNDIAKTSNGSNSKRRRGSSDETSFFENTTTRPEPQKPGSKSSQNNQRMVPPLQQSPALRQPQEATKGSQYQRNYVNQGRKLPKEAIGISGELECIISDHQKSKGSNNLVRASSGNVMLLSNLGNLRQQGHGGDGNNDTYNVFEYLPKTAREEISMPFTKQTNNVAENVGKTPKEPSSLCRAISTRMDPEELKIMGNEDYKNGRFAEALALYDAAISIDPNKASYRSNKSAALTALGRLLEAFFECKEAIRIEPNYHRAHHRLATLYLRLGETDKATYHFKQAGPEADHEDLAKVKMVQTHLNKCTEARRVRDWNTLIKETKNTISAGADSAPQIYALQAEALLKLQRHQEADQTLSSGPNFEMDDCTKFLGPIGNANVLVTRALVDLAAGRFENALEAANKAVRLDSNNKEANMVMRKANAIAKARSKGNELFKEAKFSEACTTYSEGLEHDPYNSVLLCNRAACRSKVGDFNKAIEDCNAALNFRPSYVKARLRRANCYFKLGQWEAAIQDYEVLVKETPEDEEIKKALSEARKQLGNAIVPS